MIDIKFGTFEMYRTSVAQLSTIVRNGIMSFTNSTIKTVLPVVQSGRTRVGNTFACEIRLFTLLSCLIQPKKSVASIVSNLYEGPKYSKQELEKKYV